MTSFLQLFTLMVDPLLHPKKFILTKLQSGKNNIVTIVITQSLNFKQGLNKKFLNFACLAKHALSN